MNKRSWGRYPRSKHTTTSTGALLARYGAILLLAFAVVSCDGCDESATSAERTKRPATEDESGGGHPPLPGVAQVDDALASKLERALAQKGEGYEPRTRHLEDEGSPTYTNRLILETSPYLLQHAHNPVNWFAWGEEAFAQAKKQDKPIFLSVGYSTCHWCHVMERESFEHVETARYINEHFIPIKVDREERPDIDDIYMKAVHLMRGRGGWPMTVVLTPDREPFFGGTYFPRARLRSILEKVVERYTQNPDEVAERAAQVTERIRRITAPSRPTDVPGPQTLARAAEQLARGFESQYGGFGHASKFPQPARLKFLLRYHRRTNDEAALRMVRHTLTSMANGGIHDQVGGGFHRYSTDGRWLVPHFEKMLYTNAQLADVCLEAWQVTGHDRFAEVARGVLDYVARDMTAPGGGFYSATDADSPTPDGHEEEGYFFTWTPDEIERVLGPDRARMVNTHACPL